MRLGRSAVLASVSSVLLVAVVAGPAAANTVNRGSFSCAPDQRVRLTYSLSSRATSTAKWTNSLGTFQLNATAANTVGITTQTRSVSSWSVTSGVTVTSAIPQCV